MQQQSLEVAAWRLSEASLLPAAAGASGALPLKLKKEFWGARLGFDGPCGFADLGAMDKNRRQNRANCRDDTHRFRLPRAAQLIAHDSQRAVMAMSSADMHVQTAPSSYSACYSWPYKASHTFSRLAAHLTLDTALIDCCLIVIVIVIVTALNTIAICPALLYRGFHGSREPLLRFAPEDRLFFKKKKKNLAGLAGPHAPQFNFSMAIFSAAAHPAATTSTTSTITTTTTITTITATTATITTAAAAATTATATTLFTALLLHLLLPLHLHFFYQGFFSLLVTFHQLRRRLLFSLLLPTKLLDP